ncbi:MAG: tetratricopeptide repeat protein [Longimicrobiales bacterium]
MNGNFLTRRSIALTPVIALFLLIGAAMPVTAQASRFAVLIPAFANKQGGDEDFGKDTAEEVQKLINEMSTHESYGKGDLRDALRKYGVKEDVLNDDECVPARQLASLVGVELVLCGAFTEVADKNYNVEVNVIAPAASEVYQLESFSARDPKDAAQKLAAQFGQFIEGLRWAVFCSQNTEQENWESALDACNRALEITPNSEGVLYSKAFVHWKTGDLAAAHAGYSRVLELDSANDDAMLALGLVASEMGNKEEGLRWFREYLTLNPGNVGVRMSLAMDAAQANNPEGALAILEEGMTDGDTPDPQLAEYAGLFAMNAASALTSADKTAEAKPFLEKAVRYLEPIVQTKADSADATLYRNLMSAYRFLEQNDRALALGERAVQIHADDAQLWSAYADVLAAADQRDQALQALDRAVQIDPSYQVNARRALWLIEAGDVPGAVTAANAAATNNELTEEQLDNIARRIIIAGYTLAQQKQFQQAIEYYEGAAPLAKTDQTRGMKAFFHAYALFEPANARANERGSNDEILANARATLPTFQRIIELLNSAGPYCQSSESARSGCSQVRDVTMKQIEIQQTIISRARD